MLLEKIEFFAKNNHVPIMQKDGIEFLTNYIKEHQVKRILEIGSAIGYSAIKMALVSDDIYIKTIERIECMIKNSALKNNEELVRMLFKKINLKNIKKS